MKHKKRNIVLVVLALFISLAMQAYPAAKAVAADTVGPNVVGKLLSADGLMSSPAGKFVKIDPPGPVEINDTNFPDPIFRQFILDEVDTVSDGTLSVAELKAITDLFLWNKGISDLTGIEYFTKLTYLNCSNNELTELDLSNNPELVDLSCSFNNLTSLDVTNNPKLETLDCYENNLTSLNVSNNPNLIRLACWTNALDSLDVTQNKKLVELYCGDNALTSLDVTQNIQLAELGTWNNNLTSLNVNENPALVYLDCANNLLDSLDITQNTNLVALACFGNALTSLDVTQNKDLDSLACFSNALTSLDVSQNPVLRYFDCSDNFLDHLDVSQNPALEYLDCSGNYLTALDLIGRALEAHAYAQEYPPPLRAEYNNGNYEFDFNQIPDVDISRIVDVGATLVDPLPADASYDYTTGTLTIDPNNQLPSVVYWYDTGATFEPYIAITPAVASQANASAPQANVEETIWMDVTVHLDYRTFDVIYDPAGGKWPNGSTENLIIPAIAGDTIAISDAPTREGYKFLYWKGSQYQPGQTYEVPVGGHTFVAVWEKVEPAKPIKPTPKLPKTGA